MLPVILLAQRQWWAVDMRSSLMSKLTHLQSLA